MGALYSTVSYRTNPPCDKEKRKSGSSVQHCFLTELIHHVTRRREKVGALYSAVSYRTNPPCDPRRRKKGWLLFKVQTSRLLFISALPQCGDYSRAATIQSTDVAATIYFSATAMWRLFEGGYYSKYRRRGYYLFQRYRNAATIRERLLFKVQTSRLLFISALPQCSDYLRSDVYSRKYSISQNV